LVVNGVLVDANVILDVFEDDPRWAEWSMAALQRSAAAHRLYINPVIYTEISLAFARIEELEAAIAGCGLLMRQIPREALFLAGKAFLIYKKNKGAKTSTLPDFYIGAHAAVEGLTLMTRDRSRFRSYFPTLELITPFRGRGSVG
jgi:predicted nucleic acid-binding protein